MTPGWALLATDPGVVSGATVTALAAGRWLVVHPDDIGVDLVAGTGRTSRFLRGFLDTAIASGEGNPPAEVQRVAVDSEQLADLIAQAPALALVPLRTAVASLGSTATSAS